MNMTGTSIIFMEIIYSAMISFMLLFWVYDIFKGWG